MRRYLVFATVGMAIMIYSMNLSGVAVAFPQIMSDFDSNLIVAGWVLSAAQLTATAAMPIGGKAGDMFGGKLVFLVIVGLFTVGSLACALAPNVYLLIAARCLQAIGGGAVLPVASGIVSEEFPKARQQAIGLFSSILPLGQVMGPNLGGWIVENYGWRSFFWFNLPVCAAILIAAAILIRPRRKEEESHIDLVGAGLFTGSLFAFMVGLSEIGNLKTGSWPVAVLLLGAGVAMIIAFFRHEKKAKNPILDLAVITERPFLAANVYNFALGAYILGALSLVPLYAVSVYGMTTLESGLIMTPRSVGQMVASVLVSMSLPRLGYRKPILIGTGMILASLILLGMEPADFTVFGVTVNHTVMLLAVMLISGVGTGITAPAANNACIDLMPNRIATIAGVRGMFRQTGGALGIAVASIVLENFSTMTMGFTVVMIGLCFAILVTVPMVFMMPSRPGPRPLAKVAPRPSRY